MTRLTEAQRRVLASIGEPERDDDGPALPPRRTVLALIRMGLVEKYEPEDDILARMVVAWTLRITPAGLAALSSLEGK